MSEMCDIPTHFDFLEVFRCFVTKCYACERAMDIVSAVIVSGEVWRNPNLVEETA